jgi:predicted nucleic acid-binding protein
VKSVYVDTDGLLDFLQDRQPFNKYSKLIFHLADKGHIKVLVSALSFANASYVLRKYISPEQRTQALSQVIPFVQICDLKESDITQSLSLNFADFEDGIQYATALRLKADIIVSRNIKDYEKSLIPVMSPEVFFKSIP